MIFHTRDIPFGVYHYPGSVDELSAIVLQHEAQILALESSWQLDKNSPTSARYRAYNFLKFPGTAALQHFLQQSLDDFYRRLGWSIPAHRWLQCWVNIHRQGQFLPSHIHSGCKLSGHLTLQCPPTRTIYFNQLMLSMENEPGLLTLIGAPNIPHQTTPVEGAALRLSVAFDVFETPEQLRDHWFKLPLNA